MLWQIIFLAIVASWMDDVQIFDKWQRRSELLPVADYRLEGTVLTTNKFIAGAGYSEKDLAGKKYPLRARCVLDFRGKRAKVWRDEFIWSVPDDRFIRRQSVTVVVAGKGAMYSSYPGVDKQATIEVVSARKIYTADLLPLWYNSGFVRIWGSRIEDVFDPATEEIRTNEIWTCQRDEWAAKQQRMVRFIVRSGDSSFTTLLDVDAELGVLLKVRNYLNDEIRAEYRMSNVARDGYVIAGTWECVHMFNSKSLAKHVNMKLLDFVPGISEDFDWTLPDSWRGFER